MDRLLIGLAAIVVAMVLALAWPIPSEPPVSMAGKPQEHRPLSVSPAPVSTDGKHATPSVSSTASGSSQAAIRDFREMRDWRDFIDKALQAGDGAHLYFSDVLLNACAPVTDSEHEEARAFFYESGVDKSSPTYRESTRRMEEILDRCGGFAQRPVGEHHFRPYVEQMKLAKDPASRALVIAYFHDRPAPSRGELRELMVGGDPVALHLLGKARIGKQILATGRLTEANRTLLGMRELAWELETCEAVGLCEFRTSMPDYRHAFSNGGGRAPRYVSPREFFLEYLTEEERSKVSDMRRIYGDAISRQDFSALGL